MTSARETIIEVLSQAGITNMSVEDVIAEFQASDELAAYLAGSEDVEQSVLAHLPEFLTLRGFTSNIAANVGELDPTSTQSAGTNVPAMPAAVTSAQAAAIAAVVSSDAAAKQMVSEQSEMIAVLIDKGYPGEYMASIGKLHVKGEQDTAIKQMKERYLPDANVNDLLGHADSYFIPSNDQLAQLKVLHQNQHKETKTGPSWFDFDNEKAYNDIVNVLTSGDGTFGVLIAPRVDEGEGAYKNKAWRWNTKGFVVKLPSAAPGSTTFEERNITKNMLMGFLASETAGYIISHKENGLGCTLGYVKKKVPSGSYASAVAKIPTLRVKGNNVASSPELRPINAVGNGQGKMTVRSDDFYFIVRVNKKGVWSVRKQRIALLWEQAPVWVRKGEYESLFPSKIAGGISRPDAKALQDIQDAQIALAAKIIGEGSGASRLAYGLSDFCMEIEERVNKQAANAAKELAI